MNKRGQFYLIAAMIIVSVVMGFIVVTNSASNSNSPPVQNIQNGIRIEADRTLDYIDYNNLNSVQSNRVLTNLSESYIASQNGTGENLYFIFGNYSEITTIIYQERAASFLVDGKYFNGTGEIYSFTYHPDSYSATVSLNGNDYVIGLNNGTSFYSITASLNNGEDYIYSG